MLGAMASSSEKPPHGMRSIKWWEYVTTNTKKFHYPDCASVNKMKEKNREDVVDTRDHIIASGYVPCKNCNP